MNVRYGNLNINPHKLSKILKYLFAVGLLTIFFGKVAWAVQPPTLDNKPDVTVYKTASCGCCAVWVDQLEQSGLDVEVILVNQTNSVRSRLGVPQTLASCHTSVVGNYWVEGHVPVDLVQKLLHEQPADIKGIAVPGMVPGSPGMESPRPVEYQVISVDDSGEIAVYATREGRSIR
ncbi:MAG: DUF411 domain-containing protein [Xanthomonadales bacterium]